MLLDRSAIFSMGHNSSSARGCQTGRETAMVASFNATTKKEVGIDGQVYEVTLEVEAFVSRAD